MSQITFAVDFAQSFRRGVNCPVPPTVVMEIDPSTLSDEDRELLAGRLDNQGRVRQKQRNSYPPYHYYLLDRVITAAEPTAAGVLAAIRAEDAAEAADFADRAAQVESEIREFLARPLADLLITDHRYRMVGDEWPWTVTAYVGAYAGESDDPRVQQHRTEAQVIADERNAALHARHEAKVAAEKAERDAWIAQHGSPRLRRLLAEGIKHDDVYASQRKSWENAQFAARLAVERPGWSEVAKSRLSSPDDADERDFSILDAARLIAPAAKLYQLDDESEYVAAEEFAGRWIYWPGAAS